MEKILNVRIPQKIDSTSNWENSTLVLKNGEIGVEKTIDGGKKLKIGDGVNTWNNLDYFTGNETAIVHLLDGIADGSIRTSTAAAETESYKLGTSATAEGRETKASGNMSHAEGYKSEASGPFSHAEGNATVASGTRSHSSGYGTIAKGADQTAIGKYNVQDDNSEFAFIIGNGTNASTRSNAFTIDWNGNAAAAGKKLATEEYVGNNGGKIDSISVNGTAQAITDKNVNISVPTKVSQLTNDSGYINSLPDYSNTYDAKGAAAAVLGTSSDTATSNTVYGAKALATQANTAAATANTAATNAKNTADSKVASVGAKNNGIEIGGSATAPTIGVKISSAANNALSIASDGLKVTTPAQTDYTVTVAESTPSGYAKAYTITQAASGLNATINIPKDMVVESGKVETKTSSGEWGLAGTYLVLTLANATSDRIYIDVSTLIEYVTSGSSANDAIQITVDSTTHKVTASIKDNSIGKDKLDSTVQASLNRADESANITQIERTIELYAQDKLIYSDKPAVGQYVSAVDQKNGVIAVSRSNLPDLSTYAKKDLTNIDNTVFKNKVVASGFTSGTQVQLVTWEAGD